MFKVLFLFVCFLVISLSSIPVSAVRYGGKCRVDVRVYGLKKWSSGMVAHGYLKATIRVNDKVRRNVYRRRFFVNPGEVHLVVSKNGYETHEETFTCNAGEYIVKDINLISNNCLIGLVINAPLVISRARVYVDNQFIKICRDYCAIKLSPGIHTITVQRWGCVTLPHEVTITCQRDQPRIVAFTMKKSYNNCIPMIRVFREETLRNGRVRKRYTRADIYVNGLYNGNFYRKRIRFRAGRTYTIEARNDKYGTASATFTCNRGERPNINLILS